MIGDSMDKSSVLPLQNKNWVFLCEKHGGKFTLYYSFSAKTLTGFLKEKKRTIIMINIFILCTEVIIEHVFAGFIQNMVVLIKQSNKM